MKLAIDCRMCGKSGIGAFIDGILPYLIESDTVLLLIGYTQAVAKPTVSIIPCDIPVFSLKEMLFFPKQIAAHINACDAFFTPYCNIPSGITVPIYTTIHDVVFLDVPGLASRLGTVLRKIMYLYAVYRSKGIFTVSEFSKSRIQKTLHCKKEITVVHSSVPDYLQKPLHPRPTKTDTIIFIGNIKKHKGLHTLIPAFSKLRERCSINGVALPTLMIVGSQENFRTKDAELTELQNDNQNTGIAFTGFVTNETLQTLIASAKLLVQPSLYEGFGLPPMEALCNGTRALVSDIAVFKEVYHNLPVTYFKTGDCNDLCDKMYTLWTETADMPCTGNCYSFSKTTHKILDSIQGKL
ncbi:MAG: glycosyltransferase family 4 protein [Treponema sp.]|nr:glycosyltransferase family 4 protein [Treponema sp.]